ncbi:hypothetical protein ACJ72_04174 [Emergomyces africanus]|uniref:Uncharacterized protein n=1 Tax=Emergomyces africanus TaxID=1955775 RepID=A0A1B7NXI8_9EURO|nr:hypothetical protein ACJ72_04174 [Emergomyces africanus]
MPKPPFFTRRRCSAPTPCRIDENSVLDDEVTEVTRDRKRETALTFNVFYGNPDLSRPQLKHVAFTDNAAVHTEFFEHCGRPVLVQDGKNGASGKGKVKGKGKAKTKTKSTSHAYQMVERGLPQFQELAYLAAGFNEDVLKLCVEGCAGCGGDGGDSDGDKGRGKKAVVDAMVYRPLCCSLAGYEILEDGVWMRRLMMVVARQVEGFDTSEKAKKAIGIWEKVEGIEDGKEAHPFVNMLAVPVCEPDGDCQAIVEKAIDSFVQGILKGLENEEKRSSAKFSSRESFPRGALNEIGWEDIMDQSDGGGDTDEDRDNGSDHDTNTEQVALKKGDRPSLSRHMSLENLQPVRLVVFCGIPIVDPQEPPTQGRLNMLLFTSNWPTEMIAGYDCNSGQHEYESYQRITAFHEQAILDAADFRCAICPGTKTKATTLFHCPIFFKRDCSNSSSGLQTIRDIVMRLAKYVGGNWKYPDTTAALGLDGFPHITEFVVPICQKGLVCEETACVATQVFQYLYLPEGVLPIYPDLYPSTDFSCTWKKEKIGRNPKLTSKMLGIGLISDTVIINDNKRDQHTNTNADANKPSTGAKTKTRSWISAMTIEDFRLAIEKGTTWDQLKELCFERLRIVIDFRPPVTPMSLKTSTASPVTATPSSERFQGRVLEGGGIISSFGSSFGYPISAATSWSSAGPSTQGDDGYFVVKNA